MKVAHMFFDGSGSGFWLLNVIWGLLVFAFWFVVIILVIRLLRRNATGQPSSSSSALNVLEERYARGEITHEEFTERRAVLRGDPPI